MSRIFISYRRDDSEDIAGRIFDHLTQEFGNKNLFKDVDSIPLGSDFREVIEESVQSCDVILAIIGKNWLGTNEQSNKTRIDNPDDFVRIEIKAGLKRKIPIIPLLINNAKVPNRKELPEALESLAFKNGISIRPDPDFKNDINRLIRALRKYATTPYKKYTLIAIICAVLVSMPVIYSTLPYFDASRVDTNSLKKELLISEDTVNKKRIVKNSQSNNASMIVTNNKSYDIKVDLFVGRSADDADLKNKKILAKNGLPITYRIDYKNLSTSKGTPKDLKIIVDYNPDIYTVTWLPSNCKKVKKNIVCDAVHLSPGKMHTIYYVVTVLSQASGKILNTARITENRNNNDINKDNNSSLATVIIEK